ncbi:MAG: SAF domain-containing protein, partial [Chloroflexi bacterium]|nr:SAF domain-containing protein [Chloroflexota bacterium]
MTNIHDELNRLTPEPDMDFLSRLDQQIQARIEQEIRNPMITTQGNITPLFDIRRMMLLVGVFLMVLLSGLLLLTISPSPEDDLSTSLIQTTPTIAPQDSCEVEPESGWIVHSVTEDDTLESISQRYAADSQKLLDANCITEIEVGTQLFVPAEIGYAGIVPEDYIPAGVTISEEMVTLAYYPLPPGNKVPKMNEIVGSVALRSFKPNQPFDRDGLG